MLMVAQGHGGGLKSVRAYNRKTHGIYASCACLGRLGVRNVGVHQPIEEEAIGPHRLVRNHRPSPWLEACCINQSLLL
jgi:hypothetical protein